MKRLLEVRLPDGVTVPVDREEVSRTVFSAGELDETPRGLVYHELQIAVVPDDDSNDWMAEVIFGDGTYSGRLTLPLGPRFMNEDADEYDPSIYAERLAACVLLMMREVRAFLAPEAGAAVEGQP